MLVTIFLNSNKNIIVWDVLCASFRTKVIYVNAINKLIKIMIMF